MRTKLYALALVMAGTTMAQAQNTPSSQMEKLTRGGISLPSKTGTGRLVSWRLLGTDTDATSFTVLRDGKMSAENLYDKTNYYDKLGSKSSKYQIVTKKRGVAVDTSDVTTVFTDDIFQSIQLKRPAGGTTPSGESYTYTPNDMSVGDVDGDGNYELFVKWDPSNSKDNSQPGYTGNVFIDCYKLDGLTADSLWRVDLGVNIRAGAHYTQFMVYDFDGDGRAEMMVKTAPGSKDGEGNYVSEVADDEDIRTVSNTKDWRNSSGKLKGGQEWLTAFDGLTGKALHTVFYRPNRAPNSDGTPTWGGAPSWTFNWDDRSGKTDTEYGNRGERYLAAVAHLDGPDANPSAVFCRGYYTYAYVWAVDLVDGKIQHRWLSASPSQTKMIHYDAAGNKETKTITKAATRGSGSRTMYGNGNHNISVADVDGDGKDEILWGSAALDDDGWLLYATGYGHGDAIHVSDLIPSRPGLEVFEVHEGSPYGWDLHDARTGEIIFSATSASDNGRGMAADVDATNEGFEFWSAAKDGTHNSVNGKMISPNQGSTNFRIYWDGDLQDELFDGNYSLSNGRCTPKVEKWDGSRTNELARLTADHSATCNTTKATPCLQADILGDWREEVIMWNNSDPSKINIYSSNFESDYRMPTLMHDHTYRLGVAWQNVAYNQPPHLGYYVPKSFTTRFAMTGQGEKEQTVILGDEITPIGMRWVNSAKPFVYRSKDPSGKSYAGNVPTGFEYDIDEWFSYDFTLTGKPSELGTYEIVLKSGKNVVDQTQIYDTIRIHCVSADGIDAIKAKGNNSEWVKINGTSVGDNVVLSFNLAEAQEVNIGVYSLSGAQAFGTKLFVGNTAPVAVYGLSHLNKGIYLLKVESTEGTFTKKILKR